MACGTQHYFELDFALQRASWKPGEQFDYAGWRAGAKVDLFNRLATYPDGIGDWLWQKEPWAGAAISWGLARTQETFARGDTKAAALKMALLSHYVTDPLSVSHTWLGMIGEEEDFADEMSLHHFHDQVENLPAEVIATSAPVASVERLIRLYSAAETRAYAMGKQAFEAFFARGGEACWPLVVQGIENSAPVVLALAEAVAVSEPPAALGGAKVFGPGFLEAVTRDWVMRVIFDAPDAEAILNHLADPAQKATLQARLGWKGGDIFFARDKCTTEGRSAYERWRADRDVWMARHMHGILPPRLSKKITTAWRPAQAVRF